ncbi:MAG: branched-chain amino acid ABC transporter permease [Acidimicrobiaceae bacterium]|nr:branched-chain amino acid ABC transporter permease [Acidimicrobiaceae bacterium]
MLTLVFAGLAAGGAYAILGVSIVVLHRMAGVVNFSQAVVGAFGAYLAAGAVERGWGLLWAAVAGIAVSSSLSIAIGLLFARLFGEAGAAIRTAAMIATTVGLFAVGFRLFGDAPKAVPVILPGASVSIGGVVVTAATVIVLAIAFATVLAMGWVLRSTRVGIQVRAISERPVVAELLGVPLFTRTALVWGFTGFVSSVGMLVVASNLPGSFSSLGFLIFPAMAAALVGAFRNLGLSFIGGISVGVVEAVSSYRETWSEFRGAVPFLIAAAVLLWTQRKEVWDAAR